VPADAGARDFRWPAPPADNPDVARGDLNGGIGLVERTYQARVAAQTSVSLGDVQIVGATLSADERSLRSLRRPSGRKGRDDNLD
jgi:hypothetical protein